MRPGESFLSETLGLNLVPNFRDSSLPIDFITTSACDLTAVSAWKNQWMRHFPAAKDHNNIKKTFENLSCQREVLKVAEGNLLRLKRNIADVSLQTVLQSLNNADLMQLAAQYAEVSRILRDVAV